jgi:ABC-type transport system substrate-binding protein
VCQRVDELLDDAAAASDPAERDYYLREAQQFLYVLVEEAESR